jgi:hypothetical protein
MWQRQKKQNKTKQKIECNPNESSKTPGAAGPLVHHARVRGGPLRRAGREIEGIPPNARAEPHALDTHRPLRHILDLDLHQGPGAQNMLPRPHRERVRHRKLEVLFQLCVGGGGGINKK